MKLIHTFYKQKKDYYADETLFFGHGQNRKKLFRYWIARSLRNFDGKVYLFQDRNYIYASTMLLFIDQKWNSHESLFFAETENKPIEPHKNSLLLCFGIPDKYAMSAMVEVIDEDYADQMFKIEFLSTRILIEINSEQSAFRFSPQNL